MQARVQGAPTDGATSIDAAGAGAASGEAWGPLAVGTLSSGDP